MAKLYFYYSAMNAGKTTTLLQSARNYHERGMRTLILTPQLDDRYGKGVVQSRIGLKANGRVFERADDLEAIARGDIAANGPLDCVLVDEAQEFHARLGRQRERLREAVEHARERCRAAQDDGSLGLQSLREREQRRGLAEPRAHAADGTRVPRASVAVVERADAEFLCIHGYIELATRATRIAALHGAAPETVPLARAEVTLAVRDLSSPLGHLLPSVPAVALALSLADGSLSSGALADACRARWAGRDGAMHDTGGDAWAQWWPTAQSGESMSIPPSDDVNFEQLIARLARLGYFL